VPAEREAPANGLVGTDWEALGCSRDQAHYAVSYARALLHELGMPCLDESTTGTPERFVKALLELTAGLRVDPDRHLARTFPAPTEDPGMIVVPGIAFVSLCEHHVLAFTGTAHLAYIPAPGGRVVGLSKLPRMVAEYAARPQMQERLGAQITDAITRNLDTLGAACVIRSAHSCMTIRGARATGAEMVTSHLAGEFRNDPAVRAEFLALVGVG
jgi:GTP cyclohydrolase I